MEFLLREKRWSTWLPLWKCSCTWQSDDKKKKKKRNTRKTEKEGVDTCDAWWQSMQNLSNLIHISAYLSADWDILRKNKGWCMDNVCNIKLLMDVSEYKMCLWTSWPSHLYSVWTFSSLLERLSTRCWNVPVGILLVLNEESWHSRSSKSCLGVLRSGMCTTNQLLSHQPNQTMFS